MLHQALPAGSSDTALVDAVGFRRAAAFLDRRRRTMSPSHEWDREAFTSDLVGLAFGLGLLAVGCGAMIFGILALVTGVLK